MNLRMSQEKFYKNLLRRKKRRKKVAENITLRIICSAYRLQYNL
jgi:hypothetical protein